MDNLVSRFLSFEETLGKGLVKFAYFVLLIGLAVWAVIEIVGGVILLFDRPLAGLWEIVHTPFEFLLYAILLRVATELVLAVLSIDDQLTESAVSEREARGGGGEAGRGQAGGFAATKTPSVTAAPSASQNESAEASGSSSSSPTSSSSARARPPAKKAAKKTTKSTDSSGSGASGGSSSGSAKASTASTKATVKAASASPASARADKTDDASKNASKGGASSRGGDTGGKDA